VIFSRNRLGHPHAVVIRPRRLRLGAYAFAALVAVSLIVSGVTLSGTTSVGGRLFASDRWALAAVGVVLGAVLLTPLRIRAEADSSGVRVHNLVGSFEVAWPMVRAVRYQRGTVFATLELVDDEVLTMQAVQVIDGQRAVDAIRHLRTLHAAADTEAG
jgi:hypothetical protein